MRRSIQTVANVILNFDGKPRMSYDTRLTFTLPADDLDVFEVAIIRQVLAPVPIDDLQYLNRISLFYFGKGEEHGRPVRFFEDAEIDAVMNHLLRNDAKYCFLPSKYDKNEQRIAKALGVASRTRDLA